MLTIMPFCEEHGVVYGEGCFCIECETDFTEQVQDQSQDTPVLDDESVGFLTRRPRKKKEE